MKIVSITLNNFKQHKQRTFEFTSGINLLIGPNYSGKSTVQQAMLVALFGVSAAPGSAAEMVNDEAKNFSIVMTLSNGYVVERTLKDASIFYENKSIVQGHTAVTAHLIELLELSKTEFLRTYVSEQGEPQALVDMGSTELTRFVETATRMEQLNTIIKKINDMGTTSKSQAETLLPYLLQEHREIYLDKIQEAALAVAKLQAEHASKKAALDSLVDRRAKLDSQIRTVFANQKDWERYRKHKASLEKYLADVEPMASKTLEDTSHTRRLLQNLYTEKSNIESSAKQQVRLQTLVRSKEGLVKDLHDAIQTFATTYVKPVDLGNSEADMNNAAEDASKAAQLFTSLRQQLKDGVCPACDRPFDEHLDKDVLQVKIDSAKEASDKAMAVYVEAKGRRSRLLHEQSRYNTQLALDARNKEAYATASAELAEARQDLDALASVAVSSTDLDKDIKTLSENLKQMDKHNAEISAAIKQKETILKDMSDLEKDRPDEELLDDLAALQRELSVMDRDVTHLRQDVSDTLSAVYEQTALKDRLQANLDDHDAKLKDYNEFVNKAVRCERLGRLLAKNRISYLDEIWKTLFEVTSEFVATVTGGDISKVFLSDTGIKYVENDKARSKTSASGAQKTLMGLGMKLALTKMLPCPFDCLILDEISADMDPDISLACLMTLQNYSGQSVIVSHRDFDLAANVHDLSAKHG